MKKIQILGTDCPKCKLLAEVTEKIARSLGVEFEIEKVTDINEILNFGVMMVPGLVIDGQVKVSGRVPRPEELKKLLTE